MTNEVHERGTTSVTTPTDTEVRVERTFAASREALWKAYTDPKLLAQWLGPRRMTMSVEEMDVRPGGRYRFTHRDPDGNQFVFFGEYRQIVPPELIEWTFSFEGMPRESVDRTEFEQLDDGRTRVVTTSTFASKEDRDGMLQSGMEKGMTEGFERLDELLAGRR